MTYENITERQVLCFGDSNTYGYDPVRDGRYGPDERYPMVLQSLLGPGWAVAEEGLPGRTAVFDDPITEGMNGLRLINPILMSHAPLDTVTIMLGTNDCKARFACDSYQIAPDRAGHCAADQKGAADRVLARQRPPRCAGHCAAGHHTGL